MESCIEYLYNCLFAKNISLQTQRDLATYVEYIWDLQEKGFNWLDYDAEYRRERSDEEFKAPWSMSRQHLSNQLMCDKFNTMKSSGNVAKTTSLYGGSSTVNKVGDKSGVGFVPRSYCFSAFPFTIRVSFVQGWAVLIIMNAQIVI